MPQPEFLPAEQHEIQAGLPAEAVATIRAYQQASKTSATVRAYRSDAKVFEVGVSQTRL